MTFTVLPRDDGDLLDAVQSLINRQNSTSTSSSTSSDSGSDGSSEPSQSSSSSKTQETSSSSASKSQETPSSSQAQTTTSNSQSSPTSHYTTHSDAQASTPVQSSNNNNNTPTQASPAQTSSSSNANQAQIAQSTSSTPSYSVVASTSTFVNPTSISVELSSSLISFTPTTTSIATNGQIIVGGSKTSVTLSDKPTSTRTTYVEPTSNASNGNYHQYSSNKVSSGTIAGIVISCVAALLLIFLMLSCYRMRLMRMRRGDDDVMNDEKFGAGRVTAGNKRPKKTKRMSIRRLSNRFFNISQDQEMQPDVLSTLDVQQFHQLSSSVSNEENHEHGNNMHTLSVQKPDRTLQRLSSALSFHNQVEIHQNFDEGHSELFFIDNGNEQHLKAMYEQQSNPSSSTHNLSIRKNYLPPLPLNITSNGQDQQMEPPQRHTITQDSETLPPSPIRQVNVERQVSQSSHTQKNSLHSMTLDLLGGARENADDMPPAEMQGNDDDMGDGFLRVTSDDMNNTEFNNAINQKTSRRRPASGMSDSQSAFIPRERTSMVRSVDRSSTLSIDEQGSPSFDELSSRLHQQYIPPNSSNPTEPDSISSLETAYLRAEARLRNSLIGFASPITPKSQIQQQQRLHDDEDGGDEARDIVNDMA